MLQTAKIKVRSIKELQADNIDLAENPVSAKTPLRKRKNPRPVTTVKKLSLLDDGDNNNVINGKPLSTVKKRLPKSALKEPLPWQKPIDSYFKSCQKSYKIEPMKAETPSPICKKIASTTTKTISKSKSKRVAATTTKKPATRSNRKHLGRKRLFVKTDLTTETEACCSYKSSISKEPASEMMDCITIESDSDDKNVAEKLNINKNYDYGLDLQPSSSSNHLKNTPRTTVLTTTNNSKISALKTLCNTVENLNINKNYDYDLNLPPLTLPNQLQNTPDTTVLTNYKNSTNNSKMSSLKTPCSKEKSMSRNILETLNTNEISPPVTPLSNPLQFTSSNRSSSSNKKLSQTPASSKHSIGRNKETSCNQQMPTASNVQSKTPPQKSLPIVPAKTYTKRKHKPCPPYKIIEDTTFAVDAFQFGNIENVTHYFLTHFHADHYIGLTRKFAMPLYMSRITARFVCEFIAIEESYINILELNEPHIIDNIEITALDANHCPGAIIIVFKFLKTGKCILHTGDFRAWHGMESEPIFWNNDIHTIYLDTTYISDKYEFCTQYESICKGKQLIEQFQEKHKGKRILYICGSYLIGKEKFWSALAEEYQWKVWAEGNRYKALKAMKDERFDKLLIEDPFEANMHVLPMVKINYLYLVDYLPEYESKVDVIFAIRPSGWEKHTKPQYRDKINIVGIEYSEHSSYREMQRFVKFLKPQKVLSTVPTGRNLMITAEVPQTWYKYDVLKSSSNYQPTLDSYCRQTPLRKNIRPPNMNMGALENFVSPLSSEVKNQKYINNYNNKEVENPHQVISIHSSENEIEQTLTPIKTKTEKENEISVKQKPTKKTETVSNSKSITVTKQTNLTKIKKNKTNGKNSTKKLPKSRNENCNSFERKSISLTNSSEDFEMPEILSTQNKNQRIKQTQHDTNLSGNKISETSPTIKDLKRKYQQKKSRTMTSENEFERVQSQNTVVPKNSKKLRNTQIKLTPKQNNLTKQEENENHVPQISQRKFSNSILNCQEQQKSVINNTLENDMEMPALEKTRKQISISTNTTTQTQILKVKQNETIVKELTKQNKITKQRNCNELATSRTVYNKAQTNPIYKSKTASNSSIIYDNILASSTQSLKDIPTYTPTLVTSRQSYHQPYLTPSISKLPLNPLIKSTTKSNHSNSTEEIPPSQEYIPRPLRNVLKPYPTYTPSPIKKSKDFPNANNNLQITSTPICSQIVNEILKNNSDLDLYNHSQLTTVVEETLSKQYIDKSTDHIPPELLSDPDADDDWMN